MGAEGGLIVGPVQADRINLIPSPRKLYYHGEPLNVNVHVTNNSTKTIKKIKVSGRRWGTEGGPGVGVAAHVAPSVISAQGHTPVQEAAPEGDTPLGGAAGCAPGMAA